MALPPWSGWESQPTAVMDIKCVFKQTLTRVRTERPRVRRPLTNSSSPLSLPRTGRGERAAISRSVVEPRSMQHTHFLDTAHASLWSRGRDDHPSREKLHEKKNMVYIFTTHDCTWVGRPSLLSQHHNAEARLSKRLVALRSSGGAYSMQLSSRHSKPSKAGVGPPLCGWPCSDNSTA